MDPWDLHNIESCFQWCAVHFINTNLMNRLSWSHDWSYTWLTWQIGPLFQRTNSPVGGFPYTEVSCVCWGWRSWPRRLNAEQVWYTPTKANMVEHPPKKMEVLEDDCFLFSKGVSFFFSGSHLAFFWGGALRFYHTYWSCRCFGRLGRWALLLI